MPELPEVEVTRLGIQPWIQGNTVSKIKIYNPKLRLPIPSEITTKLKNRKINDMTRISRYLLFHTDTGTLVLHLGMTGHLSLLSKATPPEKHDHLDMVFNSGIVLRYHDSRKFGLIQWTDNDPLRHHLLEKIGPDPLTNDFSGRYLFEKSRNRKITVKPFIMDAKVVAGIGNIYASESLFAAKIHPAVPAGKLSEIKCRTLVAAIKKVLSTAITTGRAAMDFSPDKPWSGYFPQQLMVYKKEGLPCRNCNTRIEKMRIGQRSTFFCENCQALVQ